VEDFPRRNTVLVKMPSGDIETHKASDVRKKGSLLPPPIGRKGLCSNLYS